MGGFSVKIGRVGLSWHVLCAPLHVKSSPLLMVHRSVLLPPSPFTHYQDGPILSIGAVAAVSASPELSKAAVVINQG